MKGLAVVENIAYFGIAESGERSSRGEASKIAEVAALDLHRR